MRKRKKKGGSIQEGRFQKGRFKSISDNILTRRSATRTGNAATDHEMSGEKEVLKMYDGRTEEPKEPPVRGANRRTES